MVGRRRWTATWSASFQDQLRALVTYNAAAVRAVCCVGPARSTMPMWPAGLNRPEWSRRGSPGWLVRTQRWPQATPPWQWPWPTRCCSASTPTRPVVGCCCSWRSASCHSCSSRPSSARPSTAWPAAGGWSSRSSRCCGSVSRWQWRSTSRRCCCSHWPSRRWCRRRHTPSRRARWCPRSFAATRSWSRPTRSWA